MRMLFILCGATRLRLGEALGIRVDKILDGGSRIIIDQKAWRGEIHDYLKTENGEREVDLPVNVAKLLVEFIGDRETGLRIQIVRRSGGIPWQRKPLCHVFLLKNLT
jgi:integrase